MEIQAYTLPGCSSCKHLKKLFDKASVTYTEIMVRRDMTIEEFKSHHPKVSNFPYVVIDGNSIGGLIETVQMFVDKGLVSSKKE